MKKEEKTEKNKGNSYAMIFFDWVCLNKNYDKLRKTIMKSWERRCNYENVEPIRP